MAKKKKIRFQDLDDILPKKSSPNFINRKAGISSAQVISFLTMTMIVIYGVSFLLEDQNGVIFASISLIVGIVLGVAAVNSEHHKKQLQKVEYLNAIFASLLGNKHNFSILVKQEDFRIVYFDSHTQKTFPTLDSLENFKIDTLLRDYGVNESEVDTISQQIKNNKSVTQDIQIKDANGSLHNYSLSIEASVRPLGFSLLRGKLEVI